MFLIQSTRAPQRTNRAHRGGGGAPQFENLSYIAYNLFELDLFYGRRIIKSTFVVILLVVEEEKGRLTQNRMSYYISVS
jgi:hypothetical protein